jgi:hypothetical protein
MEISMIKHLRKTMIAVAILSVTACGGGSENESVDVTPETPDVTQPLPTQLNVKVIDGYLSNAYICVDRNLNSQCEDDEYLSAQTTNVGEIIVGQADTNYPLIANVLQGITVDSDSGFAKHNYQMIAPAGSTFITPFTTLMVLNSMSEEDLAAHLNLSVDLLFTDYIASEQTNIQILARSIASQLGQLEQTPAQNILDLAQSTSTYISENIANLDSNSIILNTASGHSIATIDSTIKTTLLNHPVWTFANLDGDTFADEGFRIVRFTDTTVNLANQWDNFILEESVTFGTDGLLNPSGTEYLEKFVYVNEDLLIGLAAGEASDLNIWMAGLTGVKQDNTFTHPNLDPQLFSAENTWYVISDDGAEILLVKMTFSDGGLVQIVELPGGAVMQTSATLSGDTLNQNNLLTIQLVDESEPLRLKPWFKSNGLLVFREENRHLFFVMTQSLDTAMKIAGK